MVNLPDNFGAEVVAMARKKRPIVGEETKADAGFNDLNKSIIGAPLRIEIPFAEISVFKLREFAADMVEAWTQIEALTHQEALTEGRDFQKEARHVMMEAKHRLKLLCLKHFPKRGGGRMSL